MFRYISMPPVQFKLKSLKDAFFDIWFMMTYHKTEIVLIYQFYLEIRKFNSLKPMVKPIISKNHEAIILKLIINQCFYLHAKHFRRDFTHAVIKVINEGLTLNGRSFQNDRFSLFCRIILSIILQKVLNINACILKRRLDVCQFWVVL